MKSNLLAVTLLASALIIPAMGHAEDSDADRSSAKSYVKDSVITTKIKAELAEQKLSSLMHVSVDTDAKGMVVLSGTVTTKSASDKAVSIAKGVKGVVSVDNRLKIVPDKK